MQLGGAAGTLAALGEDGPRVAAALAARLGLGAPDLPWHTARGRVAELGAALAVAAGAMGKLGARPRAARADRGGRGRGRRRRILDAAAQANPVGAVRARACAARVPPLAALLLGAMAQEHERAAGAWHAEWEPLTQALALTGGAAAGVREALDGLEVRRGPDAREPRRDRRAAARASGSCSRWRRASGARRRRTRGPGRRRAGGAVPCAFRDALLAQPAVAAHLDAAALDALLDPAGYLGATSTFIERALARAERELP